MKKAGGRINSRVLKTDLGRSVQMTSFFDIQKKLKRATEQPTSTAPAYLLNLGWVACSGATEYITLAFPWFKNRFPTMLCNIYQRIRNPEISLFSIYIHFCKSTDWPFVFLPTSRLQSMNRLLSLDPLQEVLNVFIKTASRLIFICKGRSLSSSPPSPLFRFLLPVVYSASWTLSTPLSLASWVEWCCSCRAILEDLLLTTNYPVWKKQCYIVIYMSRGTEIS